MNLYCSTAHFDDMNMHLHLSFTHPLLLLVELEKGETVLDPRVEGLRAHHLHPVPPLRPRLRAQLVRGKDAHPKITGAF